jgi:DNA-binding HxlR family transcriptional regulator
MHSDPARTARQILDSLERGDVMAASCPSRPLLQHVTSRWGTLILIALLDGGTLRFSALRRRIGGVSERMLAQTLQVLESDGFVTRRAHDVVPPHVDYSLTDAGQEVARHLLTLVTWIEGNLPRLRVGQGRTPAAPADLPNESLG